MGIRHRAIGHKKRAAGAEFEERVENALTAAQQAGVVAWWSHQQPSFTLSGQPLKPTGADFAGILRGGAVLAIECKSVKGRRIMRDAIAEEQRRHLDAAAAHGGLALLAVEFRDEDTGEIAAFFVPWTLAPWKTARTAESLSLEDMLPSWRIAPTGSIARLVSACPSCTVLMPGGSPRGCCLGGAPF